MKVLSDNNIEDGEIHNVNLSKKLKTTLPSTNIRTSVRTPHRYTVRHECEDPGALKSDSQSARSVPEAGII